MSDSPKENGFRSYTKWNKGFKKLENFLVQDKVNFLKLGEAFATFP